MSLRLPRPHWSHRPHFVRLITIGPLILVL